MLQRDEWSSTEKDYVIITPEPALKTDRLAGAG